RHLLEVGWLEETLELLLDWRWLEAKTQAAMVFALSGDFGQAVVRLSPEDPRHRLLGLLEEAVRRQIQFLTRHPTTLFQCLWNTGWWYDCRQAEEHYLEPAGGWSAADAPWRRDGPKLSAWLERWRAGKEREPGFVWVRALRPPRLPLGAA